MFFFFTNICSFSIELLLWRPWADLLCVFFILKFRLDLENKKYFTKMKIPIDDQGTIWFGRFVNRSNQDHNQALFDLPNVHPGKGITGQKNHSMLSRWHWFQAAQHENILIARLGLGAGINKGQIHHPPPFPLFLNGQSKYFWSRECFHILNYYCFTFRYMMCTNKGLKSDVIFVFRKYILLSFYHNSFLIFLP